MSFASCHCHDEYSLLDGAGSAIQHALAARDAGYIALANTNHATLAGSLHHMRACREVGILGLSGVEMYFRPNRKVQGQKEWVKEYTHITLIAKSMEGWRNLMRLVSESHSTGFYGRACCDDELLERYHDGLICLTGCLAGRLAKCVLSEDHRQAEAWIRQLKRIFRHDLFCELMPHDIEEQRIANVEVVRIAEKHGIATVATIDSHYPTKEWASTQDVLLMIATGQTTAERKKKREEGEDVYEFSVDTLYHLTPAEIKALFSEHHPGLSEAVVDRSIRDTLEVAARCSPIIVDRSEKMPSVSFPGQEDNVAYLRRLAYEGLERRGYGADQDYRERIDYELSVIEKLDSVDQILIAWDVVDWAKSDRPVPKRDKKTGELIYRGTKQPIMVGPGRGSAASSAVCWAIDLTNVNPARHRLLFERFMNPFRTGKPDIDIDFPVNRVDEVETYVKTKYGEDRVVDVIAHSTFGPKAAINDVGRVLSIPWDHFRAASKVLDDQERGALTELRLLNPELDRYAREYPKAWEESCRIQGMVARKSEHAAALLLLPGPVEEYLPVERTGGQKGKMLTAFGERSGKGNALLSDFGFVGKLDLLRIAELDKQQMVVDLIRETEGVEVDLDSLPVHDHPYAVEPKVMKGFADGWLVGVFQWSATALKPTRAVKPSNILELSAINAFIRPGPRGAGLDQQYIRRKKGEEDVSYWHPLLEGVLDFSYGLVLFQESLIEVVHLLGGLSRGQADIFRKIASKLYRDPEYARSVMGEWEVPLKAGMMERDLSQEDADSVWTSLLSFSDYSFNLAHAEGYSILAYRDMWLKVHYPRQFYAAFLSCGLSQITKKRKAQKAEAVREARHLGLKIMAPDINESGDDYTVVVDGVRLGLRSVKHVGGAACKAIVEHRPFLSYEDFEARVPARSCNRTAKAALVMAGAFDRWGKRDRFTEDEIDLAERELLGMSLTSVHSIAAYADLVEGLYWTEEEFDAAEDGARVTVVGEVSGVKMWRSGKGCFVELVYGPNRWSCKLFASQYEEFEEVINSRRPLIVMGAKESYNGRSNVRVGLPKGIATDDSLPPVMDLTAYASMVGYDAEQYITASVFPEDLGEGLGVEN